MWNEKTNSPRSGKDAGADFVYYQFWNVITSSRTWVARDRWLTTTHQSKSTLFFEFTAPKFGSFGISS